MHEQFLLAALDQAWLGRGFCAPNPSVGAVAVSNGEIIAQTWHRGAGTPHAERLLLEGLPKHQSGITLYVTLEPCNHWGRTPPCVDAIIEHGIQQVVYGFSDPNPEVACNNTPALLRARGIEVVHYPLPAIDLFYESYKHWTVTRKPWVTVKMAQSLDGKIAGKGGARVFLSNDMCAEFTHKQRLHSDLILTTARTVNLDNPLLNVRLSENPIQKPVAILDRENLLNEKANVLTTALHCHVYHAETTAIRHRHPRCSYHALPLLNEHLDLNALMAHLGALGVHDVFVEAGGHLFSALHQAGLVNRTYLYLTPAILGDEALSLYDAPSIFKRKAHVTWQTMADNMVASFDWLDDALESEACLQV